MQRQNIFVHSPPGSNPSSFRFKLRKKLNCVTNISLLHAVVPNSEYTIESGDSWFYFNDQKIDLPTGYYYSLNDIIQCINMALRQTTDSTTVEVRYNMNTKIVTFYDAEPFNIRFEETSYLNFLLGFPKNLIM